MTNEELKHELEKIHAESFGWALHCCKRNYDHAKEALQISFLKVLEGKARFSGKSQFKTWFFAVIRYTSIDVIKNLKKYRQKHAYIEEIEFRDNQIGEMYDQHEVITKIQCKKAIASLTNRQQELMHLIFYHELSINQSAEIMNISGGAARKHYHRAKLHLSEWLSNCKNLDV